MHCIKVVSTDLGKANKTLVDFNEINKKPIEFD